jgi:hypothetical protein
MAMVAWAWRMETVILCPDARAPDGLADDLGLSGVRVVAALAGIGPMDGLAKRDQPVVCIRSATGAEQVVGRAVVADAVSRAVAALAGTRVVLASTEALGVAAPDLINGADITRDLAALPGSLGLIVPVARMLKQDVPHLMPDRVTHASPYDPERLGVAAMALKGSARIALWSYGFTRTHAAMVEAMAGCPVFLPRVALAARLLPA